MPTHTLTHLSDEALLRDLATLLAQDRATLAALLAHLGEVDARRLYLPLGYPSMYLYCVEHLHMSEQTAYKRIAVARLARTFPAILPAMAQGQLHLSGVLLLAPHLSPTTVEALLEAGAYKTRSELEHLLAERHPRPDLPARLAPLAPVTPARPCPELSPGIVGAPLQGSSSESLQLSPGIVGATPPAPPARAIPLAPQRYALQVTIPEGTHAKLQHAQDLLGHRVAPGNLAQVLDHALDALIQQLEQRKCAATPKPKATSCPSETRRHIPAQVKRRVWARDEGQCTFTSKQGQRCSARRALEFDHAQPYAAGGRASVGNLRLRCRAHNQYEAEQAFGTDFMRARREQAGQRRATIQAAVARERPR